MEKFHITITNNETGEVCVDLNTDALIAAIDETEGGTRAVCYTHCNTVAFIAMIAAVLQLVRAKLANLPRPILRKVKQLAKKRKNFN